MYRLDAKPASNCNFFDSQTSNLHGDYRDLLVSNVALKNLYVSYGSKSEFRLLSEENE